MSASWGYYGNPIVTEIDWWPPPFTGSTFVFTGSTYRLLSPHFINNQTYDAGMIVRETIEVPNGWIPTLMVDPLNTKAVNAFWAAGPRLDPPLWEDRNQHAKLYTTTKPATYWARVAGSNAFQLTGLGANLPPVQLPRRSY